MKRLVIVISVLLGLFFLFTFFNFRKVAFAFVFLLIFIGIGVYDFFQRKHTILRNFPVIGHFRYLLEFIRPEIQQYFIATDQSDRPFNRATRSLIYRRAKGIRDTVPFGTQLDIANPGFVSVRHSLRPTVIPEQESRLWVGGDQCQQPYLASRLNISAMSFGAISKNAVLALNRGAKLGNFAHNTGEGGLSPYHLEGGGDIVWQLGTAYFGARLRNGRFDAEQFKEKAAHPQVKMIEIKLSQGAKPSHGGILPAAKISQEIADIRGVPRGEDCVSPPTHPEFSTPIGLLEFVAKVRELSGGKPVGFKLAIGRHYEFLSICKAMLKTNLMPDFITIDGAEGGTGAAPIEFVDYIADPINDAIMFVHNALVGINLRHKTHLIASGKVTNGFDIVSKLALGADMCNSARGMMFALGCIQSLQCNANTCPTGVTTQNPLLVRGLVVEEKYQRVANFHKATVHSFLELAGAMGVNHLSELNPMLLFCRINYAEVKSYAQIYPQLRPGDLLQERVPPDYARWWQWASSERF